MTDDVDRILSDFIDAWNAGRRPRLEAFLERAAPPEREALADEIAAFAAHAPEPDWPAGALDEVRAEVAQLATLAVAMPAWRRRARLTLDQLGARLAGALDLRDEEKTTDYLGRLESGTLDPGRVSRRVLERLAELLGVRPADFEALVVPRPVAPAARAALWRAAPAPAARDREDVEILAEALSQEPWDEVDRLFLGGP